MTLWLRRTETTTLAAIPLSTASGTRPCESLATTLLTMTVVPALAGTWASAAIVAAEVSITPAADGELRQRTRIFLAFRPRKGRAYQLTMNRAVFDWRLPVLLNRGDRLLLDDAWLRAFIRIHRLVRLVRLVRLGGLVRLDCIR